MVLRNEAAIKDFKVWRFLSHNLEGIYGFDGPLDKTAFAIEQIRI